MSFISVEFIILFSIVVPLYFILPERRRIILLLVASYVFYSFSRLEYILLIAFSTLVDYIAARQLSKTRSDDVVKRRMFLFASILVNLGVLFIFKYFNFFSESTQVFVNAIGLNYGTLTHELILPVGISFYTFQSMAYTIDVYRGDVDAEQDFITFATYIAFFPQLVAGPIERAGNILPQFKQKHVVDYERFVSGMQLILWGAFKKVVIADRLAIYVNGVYNDLSHANGLTMLVATFFFTFQIYCDFSGYSDIAIGVARVLGFNLMENFRQPYLSQSIREFWQRWHISLSTWFRDYVYIPLGGNRVPFTRNLLNLMIVFLVSGLWHGANWTFVIWGAIHGVVIVIENIIQHFSKKSRPARQSIFSRIVRTGFTFLIVSLAWIFFRANTIADAFYVLGHLFDFTGGRSQLLAPYFEHLLDPRIEFLMGFVLIGFLMLSETVKAYFPTLFEKAQILPLRWAWYYGATLWIGFSLIDQISQQPFIYFQF